MAYIAKKYSPDKNNPDEKQRNNFIEDERGGNHGVEYDIEGDTYRTLCVNMSNFDFSNRTATANFITQIKKANGSWSTEGDGNFDKTVSDLSGFIYITPDKFGQMELSPDDNQIFNIELDEDGEVLSKSQKSIYEMEQEGITTEAQFFLDTIVDNIYGAPVDISMFIVTAIKRKKGLI